MNVIIAMIGGLATVTLHYAKWLCHFDVNLDNADDYDVFAR